MAGLEFESLATQSITSEFDAGFYFHERVTLLFYREPARSSREPVASVVQAFQNMVVVLGNFPFVAFI